MNWPTAERKSQITGADDVRTEIGRFHASNIGRLTAALATSVLFFLAI